MNEGTTWRRATKARLSLFRLLAVPAAVLALAGCESAHPLEAAPPVGTESVVGGQGLGLTADPDGKLAFEPRALSAKRGKVTILMDNPAESGREHGIAIRGRGVHKVGPVVAPGHASALTVALRRGTYELYCPVDHHAADGMTATLAVR